MNGVPKTKSQFEDNPLAQAILREGLRIQDRFTAEPIYAKTGKAHLKSVGVEELKEVKRNSRENRGTGILPVA